ncbi:hypothetical protein B0H17DRAFT_1208279 [Mycena rosella]|uniref:Uncharacterized protein n=1 Tax=Mycena rosella TaxID=1033263 RepID=A0AAD7D115_MYCRO|nr:hypothetical protein B0H17DRAFT_1208279 [Mycena rosella]
MLQYTPVGCIAVDQHYTDEDIIQLNIKIQCLVTCMPDEEGFLVHHEQCLCSEADDVLANQVQLVRMDRSCFNSLHMEHLVKLSKEAGFRSAICAPNMVCCSMASTGDMPMRNSSHALSPTAEDRDEEDLADAFANVLCITIDSAAAAEDGRHRFLGKESVNVWFIVLYL